MQIKFEKGFTLIEVIVVVSVAAILTTVGIASFSSYNQTEKVKTASLELVNALNTAKARAQSQEKPSSCNPLNGYKVEFCYSGGCGGATTYSYVLYAVCGANSVSVYNTKFPQGISIDTTNTTANSFSFRTFTGAVEFGGVNPSVIKVKDTNSSLTKTINVYSDGRIILND